MHRVRLTISALVAATIMVLALGTVPAAASGGVTHPHPHPVTTPPKPPVTVTTTGDGCPPAGCGGVGKSHGGPGTPPTTPTCTKNCPPPPPTTTNPCPQTWVSSGVITLPTRCVTTALLQAGCTLAWTPVVVNGVLMGYLVPMGFWLGVLLSGGLERLSCVPTHIPLIPPPGPGLPGWLDAHLPFFVHVHSPKIWAMPSVADPSPPLFGGPGAPPNTAAYANHPEWVAIYPGLGITHTLKNPTAMSDVVCVPVHLSKCIRVGVTLTPQYVDFTWTGGGVYGQQHLAPITLTCLASDRTTWAPNAPYSKWSPTSLSQSQIDAIEMSSAMYLQTTTGPSEEPTVPGLSIAGGPGCTSTGTAQNEGNCPFGSMVPPCRNGPSGQVGGPEWLSATGSLAAGGPLPVPAIVPRHVTGQDCIDTESPTLPQPAFCYGLPLDATLSVYVVFGVHWTLPPGQSSIGLATSENSYTSTMSIPVLAEHVAAVTVPPGVGVGS